MAGIRPTRRLGWQNRGRESCGANDFGTEDTNVKSLAAGCINYDFDVG